MGTIGVMLVVLVSLAPDADAEAFSTQEAFASCKAALNAGDHGYAVQCLRALPPEAKGDISYDYYLGLALEGAGHLADAIGAFKSYAERLEATGTDVPREVTDKIGALKYRLDKAERASSLADALDRTRPLSEQKRRLEEFEKKHPEDPSVRSRLREIGSEIAEEKARHDLSGLWVRRGSRLRVVQNGSRLVATYDSVSAHDRESGFGRDDTKLRAVRKGEHEVTGTITLGEPATATYVCDEGECTADCSDSNRYDAEVHLVVSDDGREMTGWADVQRLRYRDCSLQEVGPKNERWQRLVGVQ